jgi:hypothetical protein
VIERVVSFPLAAVVMHFLVISIVAVGMPLWIFLRIVVMVSEIAFLIEWLLPRVLLRVKP